MVEFLLAKEKARVRFPLPANIHNKLNLRQNLGFIDYLCYNVVTWGHGGIGRRNGLKEIEPY